MQVNDERLKELLGKVEYEGNIACPDNVPDCTNHEGSCVACWTEYLAEKIW